MKSGVGLLGNLLRGTLGYIAAFLLTLGLAFMLLRNKDKRMVAKLISPFKSIFKPFLHRLPKGIRVVFEDEVNINKINIPNLENKDENKPLLEIVKEEMGTAVCGPNPNLFKKES
jgi:hypothetical protein